jgi:hypothetical protein
MIAAPGGTIGRTLAVGSMGMSIRHGPGSASASASCPSGSRPGSILAPRTPKPRAIAAKSGDDWNRDAE